MRKWPYYALLGLTMVLVAFEIPRFLVALGIINGDDAMGFYTLSILWGWPLYVAVLASVVAIPYL